MFSKKKEKKRNRWALTFYSPPRTARKLLFPQPLLEKLSHSDPNTQASTADGGMSSQPDTAGLNEVCALKSRPSPLPLSGSLKVSWVLKLSPKYSKLPVEVRKILLCRNWLASWSPYSHVHQCQQILFLGHKASNCFLGFMGIPGIRGKLPRMTIRP